MTKQQILEQRLAEAAEVAFTDTGSKFIALLEAFEGMAVETMLNSGEKEMYEARGAVLVLRKVRSEIERARTKKPRADADPNAKQADGAYSD